MGLIILAHVGIPDWVKEIRNFDVPLMVFISGYLSVNSFARSKGYWDYLKKRFFRLVVPTWIFLIIYFCSLLFFLRGGLSLDVVIKSFLLQNDSIGYVWIIRVYLICAIIVPFVLKACSLNRFWIYLGLVYLLYEFLYVFGVGENNRFVEGVLFYMIPYGTILVLGMRFQNLSQKIRLIILSISALIFISSEVFCFYQSNSFVFAQEFKYPPRIIYLSHAMVYISILMLFLKKTFIINNKYILMASRSTLWLYLWHILILLVVKKFFPDVFWGVKWIIVIAISFFIVLLQNLFLDCVEKKRIYSFLKVFRG